MGKENTELKMMVIEVGLISEGLPIVRRDYAKMSGMEIDSMVMSGLFTAIASFANEVFGDETEELKLKKHTVCLKFLKSTNRETAFLYTIIDTSGKHKLKTIKSAMNRLIDRSLAFLDTYNNIVDTSKNTELEKHFDDEMKSVRVKEQEVTFDLNFKIKITESDFLKFLYIYRETIRTMLGITKTMEKRGFIKGDITQELAEKFKLTEMLDLTIPSHVENSIADLLKGIEEPEIRKRDKATIEKQVPPVKSSLPVTVIPPGEKLSEKDQLREKLISLPALMKIDDNASTMKKETSIGELRKNLIGELRRIDLLTDDDSEEF